MNEDPHHCHCFSIHPTYFMEFKKKLENISFREPLLQENHGHVFGLTKRLDEYTQIHVKVLKNGKNKRNGKTITKRKTKISCQTKTDLDDLKNFLA